MNIKNQVRENKHRRFAISERVMRMPVQCSILILYLRTISSRADEISIARSSMAPRLAR